MNINRTELDNHITASSYYTQNSDDQLDDRPPYETILDRYRSLRRQYLEVRETLCNERWENGINSVKAMQLVHERNEIRAEIEPLAKKLKRTDWPPTPWEK